MNSDIEIFQTAKLTGYRAKLLNEFANRKASNTRYSIRSFARDLGVSATAICQVLSGKRNLSKRAAEKVAEKLQLTPMESKRFLKSIVESKNKVKKENLSNTDFVDEQEYLQLKEDQFRLISEWYYAAILCLCQFPDNRADTKWLAKRVGISEIEIRNALLVLQRLGYIEIKNGKLKRLGNPIKTTDGIVSGALRKCHKQNLKLAEASIDRDPIDRRIFGAISIPIKLNKMNEASKLIAEFKEKMSSVMSTEKPDEVYTFALQFFPITRNEK